jgi:hypothetical protein
VRIISVTSNQAVAKFARSGVWKAAGVYLPERYKLAFGEPVARQSDRSRSAWPHCIHSKALCVRGENAKRHPAKRGADRCRWDIDYGSMIRLIVQRLINVTL